MPIIASHVAVETFRTVSISMQSIFVIIDLPHLHVFHVRVERLDGTTLISSFAVKK
jgi:hypothetical protein